MGPMTRVVVGLVLIAVAFIIFPIVLTGAGEITGWTGANASENITQFTGLEPMVKVGPLLIFIGLLAGGGILTFTGVRAGTGRGQAKRR